MHMIENRQIIIDCDDFDAAIKSYNKYSKLEDSLMIYRLYPWNKNK